MSIFANKWLRSFLVPFSMLYRLIIFFRNKFYDWNLLPSFKLNKSKVISIGNLSVGGTGKTPAVELLAGYLFARGQRVAVVSRGYRRKTRGSVIVSNGKNLFVGVKEAGDEPYLLAQKLKGIPVIVDADRFRGGRIAEKEFNVDYVILDDGFQHRRLTRDIDIVLVDVTTALRNAFTLPAGPLRESWASLSRADLIWLTKINSTSRIEELIRKIAQYSSAPIVLTKHTPTRLIRAAGKREIPLEQISGKNILAFSGIANPHSFEEMLKDLGANIVNSLIFRDHYDYDEKDLQHILNTFRRSKAEWIVTTEKDFVRGHDLFETNEALLYLEIKMKIIKGHSTLSEVLGEP